MKRAIRVLHSAFHRHGVAAVVLLTAAPVGCAMLTRGGRMGTVDHNRVEALASATADVDARVEAAVSAALVQWKSEMHNSIDATLQARFGDSAGRDLNKTTTDSLTSVILSSGVISTILAALSVYYRTKMAGADKVSGRLIGEIERRRKRVHCDCGECADCIVRAMKGRGDKVGRMLHEKVKRVTESHKAT